MAPAGDDDAVDRIVAQWRRERPDLDPSAKQVTGRVVRLSSIFQRRYAEAFTEIGLNEGDYGLLVALRRAGDPFTLTPTELARTRMMTSGGMTAAIDRVDRLGFVERLPNPDDRRGSLVRLSAKGRTTIDRAMELHTEVEHDLLAALSVAERDRLSALLRKVLRSVDD